MKPSWKQTIQEYAEKIPEHIALSLREHNITYRDLDMIVNHTIELLKQKNIGHGSRIALLCPARPEAIITFLACCELGAIWVSLNPKYKETEIEYIIEHANPDVIISVSDFEGMDYRSILNKLNKKNIPIVFFDHSDETPNNLLQALNKPWETSSGNMRNNPIIINGEVQKPCMLVYTSGTTGKPKGVLLSESASIFRATTQSSYFKTKQRPSIINFSPINHVGGMQFRSMAILSAGGTIHFQERFKPHETLEIIRKKRINMLMLGPTMLHLLMREETFNTDIFDQLEWYISAGAALPVKALELISKHCKKVATVYGSTESCATVSYASLDDSFDAVAYTIGSPIPHDEMRVADKENNELSYGEEGELQIRKKHCMIAYLNNPKATEEAFTKDGWFKTGDIAIKLKGGNFKIVGRIKEMFKSGGYNVYPREIEIILETHPSVKIAAVIPVDDPVFQQVGHAFILLNENSTETEKILTDWLKSKLANYKVPKRIFIHDELPMLPIGKVDKIKLKELSLTNK